MTSGTQADTGRWELLRAVGALTLVAPPASDRVVYSLGLTPWTRAEHTRLFVLGLPPYASIHLGPEGKLGGEGADRVAGVWRVLGLAPPADADHLGAILGLYSELGEAADAVSGEAARSHLGHTRAVVLWEHLWPWLPVYLDALDDEDRAAAPWVRLTRRILSREAARTEPATVLPLALRAAPDPITTDQGPRELLDACTIPVRSGFVITAGDLTRAAGDLGVGRRRGERRFILDAMLGQDPAATLTWLGDHARAWARRHRRRPRVTVDAADPAVWWAERADHSAAVLAELAAGVR